MNRNPGKSNAFSFHVLTRIKTAILLAFILMLTFSAILDPGAHHRLLRLMAPALDSAGIDVVQNWESAVQIGDRPVLAPLAGYPARHSDSRWQRELDSGVSKALVATRRRGNNTFRNSWDAQPNERIFISFAAEDSTIANKVADILEARGYIVFVYRRTGRRPVLSTQQIAYFLSTASTHLVLDTKTARTKEGVFAEALTYAKYYSAEIIEENNRLKNEITTALANKPQVRYADLLQYFRRVPAFSNIPDSLLKKEIEDKYAITETNLPERLSQQYAETENRIMSDMNYYETNYPPFRLNKWLKAKKASFFNGSPFICGRCHLPYIVPVCLAVP